jgi:HEXXH motif-containing protein
VTAAADTDLLSPLAGGLATAPAAADSAGFVEAIAAETTRQALLSFAQGCSELAPAAVADVLRALAERVTTFEAAWHPALGALTHAARARTPALASTAAIELAVHAHREGVDGRWAADLPPGATVPLGGRTLSGVERIEVSASAGRVTMRAWSGGSGRDFEVQRAAADDPWGAPRRLPRLAPFGHRTSEDAAGTLDSVGVEMRRALTGGLHTLELGSPRYAAWVTGIVRQVAPVRREGTAVGSWSSLHYPGLVNMTLFESPLDMAETLVHEASHQYFHLVDRLLPLVKRGAPPLYSPVKERLRPLTMVLLAYHAFANVSLLFGDLHAAGAITDAAHDFHQADLREWLPVMARGLDSAPGLTDAGRALLAGTTSGLRAESRLEGSPA